MSVKNAQKNNGTTSEMPAISPLTTIGRYQVIRTLGSGGMGEVLLCRDTQSEREIAIKVATPEGVKRLQAEADTLAKIDHPNVVRFIASEFSAASSSSQPCFLAIEYIEGYSLLHLIRARRLTVVDILDYAIQLLTGLEAIHRSGFLHRDLKPANIMVDKHRKLKIIDFGIVQPHRNGRGVQFSRTEGPLTEQGHIVGTINYLAPEVLSGDGASTSSDLYSAGLIIWEMIHHRLPFSSRDRNQLVHNIFKQNLEWSPAIGDFLPDGFITLISRMIAKSPDKRPTLNLALIGELKKIAEGLNVPDPLRTPCPTNKTYRRPVFNKMILSRNSISDVELPYLALVRDHLRLSSAQPTDQEIVSVYLSLKKICADARGERIKQRLLESRSLANSRPKTWQANLRATLIPIAIGTAAFAGVGLLRYIDTSLTSHLRTNGVTLNDIVRNRGIRAPAGQLANSRLTYDVETIDATGKTHHSTETRIVRAHQADAVIWDYQIDQRPPVAVEVPVGALPSNAFFAPLSGDHTRLARVESYSTDFLNLSPGKKFTIQFQSPLKNEIETQICHIQDGGKERVLKVDFNAVEVSCERTLARGSTKLHETEESYLFLPEIGVILQSTQTLRENTPNGNPLFKQTKRSALNIEKSSLPSLRDKSPAR